jgi:outer membrane receptor protein involved in Fe transport
MIMANWLRASSCILFVFITLQGYTQGGPGRERKGGGGSGRFYGKVLDGKSKDPVEYAILRLYQSKRDSLGNTSEKIVGGGITEKNGDFSIDNVPLDGKLKLFITAIGFDSLMFNIEFTPAPGIFLKDLGNLLLNPATTQLKTVEIVEEIESMRLDIDKRVYNVDKNPVNAGGTAEDVLRTVPSVQVDMDGNVALRGSSPTIFVDGRPTTLTIDQIPADAIQSIEVITNPSAKFDASGGMSGIINIVMKKNRSMGYNGSLRAGVDSRGRMNTGLDLNAQEGKFNLFLSGNFNQRRRRGDGLTTRLYNASDPDVLFEQTSVSDNFGYFVSGRGGFDWLMDNRNTLTISQNIHQGNFEPEDYLETYTDTLATYETLNIITSRESRTSREFRNYGTSILYKHLFSKEGRELTADLNYNAIRSEFTGDYDSKLNDILQQQRQIGSGEQSFITLQSDFKTPLKAGGKMEAGIRSAIRDYTSKYENFVFDPDFGTFVEIPLLQVNYKYTDQVYAAYGQYSQSYKKWGWQIGLRAESSDYKGELIDTDSTFSVSFPLSLFPSAFTTYKLSDKQNIQFNYSRRINRPSFFRLIPFVDYTDSLNISTGNPGLKPEFTNSFELSYQNVFSKKHNLLTTLYYKHSTNLMTRYQVLEYSPVLAKDILINTWVNASSSQAYGLEFIIKNSWTKWFETVTNLNFYNSSIDGSNIAEDLSNERYSWFGKLNTTFKFGKGISLQITGEYNSRRALEVGSGEGGGQRGGGGGGGGGMFGGSVNTIQGYTESNYGVDGALKYEFNKDRMSLSLGVSDIFKTRRNITYQESEYFTQRSESRRDWQVFRLNFSWKFGKPDATLFKRKNTGSGGGEGMDMM